MSIPNNWGDWRPNLTPHTGNLQATDLIECTMIVGGLPVNTAITGAQIIAASGSSIAWGAITGTLSSQTDLQTALNAKQATLVSGTNIKTVNSTSLLGSGDVAVQPTLVSGTNIKTINSTSLLGSGDIVIGGGGLTVGTTAIASGTIGGILFQNGSNLLAQDPALFWDNTNKRLGVGATPTSTVRLDVRAQGALSTDIAFRVRNSANTFNAVEVLGNQQFNITQSDSTIGNKSFVIKNPTGTNDNLAWNNGGWLIASNAASRYSLLSSPTTTGVSPLEIQHSAGNRLSMYVDTNSTLFKMETNGVGNANEISMLGGNIHRVLTNATLLMTLGYSTTTNSPVLALWKSGNFSFFGSGQSLGAGAFTGTNVIRLNSGTAPTDNPTDSICFYSSDIVAGNSAPHFRTENGNIIKLYQQATGGASSTFVVGVGTAVTDASTFDGYTLGQIVKALRNTGILA